jgi:cell division protein FtsB
VRARRTLSGQGPVRAGGRATGAPSTRSAGQRTVGQRAGAPRGTGFRASALRRAAGPAWRIRAPRTPRRLSGRAATLVLLLVALVLAYAYPVRVYLAQQAEIDRMRTAQDAQRARIAQLTEQLGRWDDDQYVIVQARKRLHYVHRGELVYVVGESPSSSPTPGGPGDPRSPWYSQLWTNVQAVDNPVVAP